MPHELPKAYEPGAIEARWAEYWVREKLFHVETPPATLNGNETRPVCTLLLPPPVSIAHRIIESWYGEELPGSW